MARSPCVPDRLCAQKDSRFYVHNHPEVRVSIDGVDFTGRVVEFCISGRWARVISLDAEGKAVAGAIVGGNARIRQVAGRVVVWFAADPVPDGALTAPTPPAPQPMTGPAPAAQPAESLGDQRCPPAPPAPCPTPPLRGPGWAHNARGHCASPSSPSPSQKKIALSLSQPHEKMGTFGAKIMMCGRRCMRPDTVLAYITQGEMRRQ